MAVKTKTTRIIITLIPFIIASLIILPRLLSPQFGFFDDARTLSQSQRFLNGDFSMEHDKQAGRFRPVHWLYYAVIYALAGYHPFWFFLANLFLLFILLIEIRQLVQRMGGSQWQTLMTSLLFVFSMPIIENFYTLSKGEPLQLVFLLAAILMSTPRREPKAGSLWVASSLSALFFLLALMVKETTIVMLPVTLLWALYVTLTKDESLKQDQKRYWSLFGASVLAAIIYLILRTTLGVPFITGGTYSNRYLVDLGTLLQKLLRWITQFAFNFHYMIPLILLLLVLTFNKSRLVKEKGFEIFKWGIWWILWILILIPWDLAESYYLLPFSLGIAFLIGEVVPKAIRATAELKNTRKIILSFLLGLTLFLWVLTLPSFITSARMQLHIDRLNQAMLEETAQILPKNGQALVNIQVENEYVYNMELSLRNQYGRRDIRFNNVDSWWFENPSFEFNSNTLLMLPTISHQPNLTVRMGVQEAAQNIWNQKLLTHFESTMQRIYQYSDSFHLSNINLPVLACPIVRNAGFCQKPDPLFDFRTFTYGWEIYQIQ